MRWLHVEKSCCQLFHVFVGEAFKKGYKGMMGKKSVHMGKVDAVDELLPSRDEEGFRESQSQASDNRKSHLVLYSIGYGPLFFQQRPYGREFPHRGWAELAAAAAKGESATLVLPNLPSPTTRRYHEELLHLQPTKTQILFPAVPGEGSLVEEVSGDIELVAQLKAQAAAQEVVWRTYAPSTAIDSLVSHINQVDMVEGSATNAAKWGSKLGSKQIFRASGVPTPDGGHKLLMTEEEIKQAVYELYAAGHETVVVKLSDSSFTAGGGNIYLDAAHFAHEGNFAAALRKAPFTWDKFLEFLSVDKKGGCIVEAMVSDVLFSPSGQMRITDEGPVLLATHEQVLVNVDQYMGCVFPARKEVQAQLIRYLFEIAKDLTARGVRGTFGVDFVVTTDLVVYAVEVNLRQTGTCHPIAFVKAAMKVWELDESGNLLGSDGKIRCYANKWTVDPILTSLTSLDAIEVLQRENMAWDPETQLGVMLHITSAIHRHGFLEVTAVSHSQEEAVRLQIQAVTRILEFAVHRRQVATGNPESSFKLRS